VTKLIFGLNFSGKCRKRGAELSKVYLWFRLILPHPMIECCQN